ncbi:MAG: hypothetical protein ACTINM_08815 [Acetobacter cibinongensis]
MTAPSGRPDHSGINWRACLLCVLTNFAVVMSCATLLHTLGLAPSVVAKTLPFQKLAVIGLAIAPLLETSLFFSLPYFLLSKTALPQRAVWWLFFIISITSFGVSHYGGVTPGFHRNWLQALLVGGFGGLCYARCFYVTMRSRIGSPFLTTALSHFLYNFMALTAVFLFG